MNGTQSGRVEIELRQQCLQYGGIMKKVTIWRILEMQENTGEEFKLQNSYEFSACGRETVLAIEMQETS